MLLQLIRTPGYVGSLGSSKGTEYDSNLKRRTEINTKLIVVLKKEFGIELPEGFKVYERCKGEASGTYRLKFHKESWVEVLGSNITTQRDIIINKLRQRDESISRETLAADIEEARDAGITIEELEEILPTRLGSMLHREDEIVD